jgi:hypothetical protein
MSRDQVEAAFKRSAEIDARRVNVAAQDAKVNRHVETTRVVAGTVAQHSSPVNPGTSRSAG